MSGMYFWASWTKSAPLEALLLSPGGGGFFIYGFNALL